MRRERSLRPAGAAVGFIAREVSAESFGQFARAYREPFLEGSPQVFRVAEAGQACGRRHRRLAIEQQIASRLEANLLDIAARAHADFLLEQPTERAWRHVRLERQRLDRQVVGKVRRNPLQQPRQPLHPASRWCQQRAELRLATGPAQEHHQALGNCQGQGSPEVGIDQGQGQVDAGGDAR